MKKLVCVMRAFDFSSCMTSDFETNIAAFHVLHDEKAMWLYIIENVHHSEAISCSIICNESLSAVLTSHCRNGSSDMGGPIDNFKMF